MMKMAPNSIDSMVTDPPAGISFMGKDWDKDKGGRDGWIEWMTSVMVQARRVLKPGAHGFVWALPRTSHWTATALENAGFEIRDIVTHVFGSGFPKSHNISKGIDKKFKATREVVGGNLNHRSINGEVHKTATMVGEPHSGSGNITAPSTDQAKQWDGWGTALKPAGEHWILIRKPLSEKTIVKNVLKHETGGINIDASRIGNENREIMKRTKTVVSASSMSGTSTGATGIGEYSTQGRFPSNFICSGEARDLLDEQSGTLKSGGNTQFPKKGHFPIETSNRVHYKENGGASRFFYCAKASKRERNEGLEGLPEVAQGAYGKFAGDGRGRQTEHQPTQNHHPTVKAQKLMKYLIIMITPPGGTVLDPFMGSGSTGVAAKSLGFKFIGIEKEPEYFEIAQARINAV